MKNLQRSFYVTTRYLNADFLIIKISRKINSQTNTKIGITNASTSSPTETAIGPIIGIASLDAFTGTIIVLIVPTVPTLAMIAAEIAVVLKKVFRKFIILLDRRLTMF